MIYEIDPLKVKVSEDRVRKDFDKEKLQRLAVSFKSIGQIAPGVCVKIGDDVLLVAGERRLRACKIAGIPFQYLLRDECSEEMMLEIELEENLNRADLRWQEEVAGLEKLHRLRTTQKEKIGQYQSLDDTGEELERSREIVRKDLELAEWAKEFPEIRDARTKTDAAKIIKRYKAELLQNQLLSKAVKESTPENTPEGTTTPTEEILEIEGSRITKTQLMEYDSRIILGDFLQEINRFEDGSINLVLFDPPWGANLSQIRDKPPSKEDIEDEPELFLENIQQWLALLYRKMAPDSHLYLFFAIRFHSDTYRALRTVGFQVNDIPLIWHKHGAHVTRSPEVWPGRSYEPIAFARKGQKKLITLGSPDVISTAAPTATMKSIHPNAKHPDVYWELLKRSAYPGDTVLDPMAGSGMAAVAMETFRASKRLNWFLIEQKQEFRDLALMNVIKGYHQICNREPIERSEPQEHSEVGRQYDHLLEQPQSATFTDLAIGSYEWKAYWREHPDQQEDMLKFKASKEAKI